MSELLLTQSQELQLLQDQDVDTIMTLFNNEPTQQEAQQFNLYNQVYNTQSNGVINGPTHYPIVMPDLVLPAPIPSAPSVITNEEYAGPLDFEVLVDPHQGIKNPWVYSSVLNKIFIAMSSSFPIDFKWNGDVKNLYVRATPLFSLAQHAQELVSRCVPHSMPSDASNLSIPKEMRDHVIRCHNPSAEYGGNVAYKAHLNVLVPLGLPQTGTDTVRLMYSFVCKNSCVTGMNRKPFEVIFTLEDNMGNVLGRRKLSVRVCSCPKRDKEKEENDYLEDAGKRGGPPAGKKRKLDKNDRKPPAPTETTAVDTKDYTITINGKHNVPWVCKMVHGLLAADSAKYGPNENRTKCMEKLSMQIKNFEQQE